MRYATLVLVVSAGLISSVAAPSAAATRPPMGNFLGAYYACDQGQGFAISYDSKDANTATVTTSNNNTRHQLKRVSSAQAPEFSGGGVTISLAGDAAQVQGTGVALNGCKLKTTT